MYHLSIFVHVKYWERSNGDICNPCFVFTGRSGRGDGCVTWWRCQCQPLRSTPSSDLTPAPVSGSVQFLSSAPPSRSTDKWKTKLLLKEQTIRWSFSLSRVFSPTWFRCGSRRSDSKYLRGQSPLRLQAVCSEQFYNQFDNVWINTELWSNPLRQI